MKNRKIIVISKSEASIALIGFIFCDKDIIAAKELSHLSKDLSDENTYILIYENFSDPTFRQTLQELQTRFNNAIKLVFRADSKPAKHDSHNFFYYNEPLTQEDLLKQFSLTPSTATN